MQLKSSTDYAIRIVCYLATHNGMISTTELSKQLYIASTYIPKVAKKLKDANIIVALEGVNGGYTLAKRAEDISLKEIISCMEETMAINRCLERDGFCSRNAVNHCRVHKVLLDVQNTFNNKLENIKVSDLIRPGKDEYFGRFYVVLKVNLKKNSYALLSVRPYKKKLEHDQAVQMILNGECGKFSDELLHCFKKVSSQNNWIKRSEREAV